MTRTNLVLALVALLASLPAPAAARGSDRDLRRDAVVRAVEKVGPAVVNISTEVVVKNPYADRFDPFGFFPRGRRGRVENSLGSGVIVDPAGYVLTNDHVISAASRITVTLMDGREVAARLVGSDRASDLAVLQLEQPGPWPAVPMGSSDDLMIGETLIAIGNPFGLQSTVTTGVVSALGRTLTGPDDTPYADFIQTDAAINPGNSGGALLNIAGELVGINSQIVGRGQNLGFAIPIDRARKVYRELVTYGKVRPAWTGMVLEDLDARDLRALGLGATRGVLVRKVFLQSPAAAAGIDPGDVIVAVDDQRVTNIAELDTALARVNAGSTVTVRLVHDGKRLARRLVVKPFPKKLAPQLAWNLLGLSLAERGGRLVITRVRSGSAAAEIGLVPGLVVEQLNGRDLGSLDDFEDELPDASYRRSVNLVVRARGVLYRVTLPLTARAKIGRRG